MRFTKFLLPFFQIFLPLTVLADPETDLREAVSALARTSYAWETTTRQRFSGEATGSRPNSNAALEIQGKFDANGYTEITLLPSKEFAAPVTAVLRMGDVVTLTPLGWLRRTEIRQTPGPDRTVEFEGKQVRLTRASSVALKVSAYRPLTEDLFDLIADLKSFRDADGWTVADLPERTIEQLWGGAQAKRAPEVKGTVSFKLSAEGLTEYQTTLSIGTPNSRTKKIAWSTQQWTTRISGIRSTSVHPPDAAVRALEK